MLRIATDHPEAVEDARTESVAAPIARAAGLLVPQLLVFDDSRALVDRPYSIWERIHGETLGLLAADPPRDEKAWSAVGRELAALHSRVRECQDPRDWLDQPDRALDLAARAAGLFSASRIDVAAAREVEAWIEHLTPLVTVPATRYFLHNDIHQMNLMCTRRGVLPALIDWGDAGWGDPSLEFSQIPLGAMPFVMAAYEAEAPGRLSEPPEARIIWDKLDYALETLPELSRRLTELRRFIEAGGRRWRQAIPER